jgi:hypothetical protein
VPASRRQKTKTTPPCAFAKATMLSQVSSSTPRPTFGAGLPATAGNLYPATPTVIHPTLPESPTAIGIRRPRSLLKARQRRASRLRAWSLRELRPPTYPTPCSCATALQCAFSTMKFAWDPASTLSDGTTLSASTGDDYHAVDSLEVHIEGPRARAIEAIVRADFESLPLADYA